MLHVVASTLSLPHCRFQVVAIQDLLGSSEISTNMVGRFYLNFFVIFSYLFSMGCCVVPGFLTALPLYSLI